MNNFEEQLLNFGRTLFWIEAQAVRCRRNSRRARELIARSAQLKREYTKFAERHELL